VTARSAQVARCLAGVLSLALSPCALHAQAEAAERPTAALFATAGAIETDAALDSALQAALDTLGVVRVTVKPGLDLEAVQLAIDCVGQSAACLYAVAAQSGVEVLIAPSLTRSADGLALSVLRFDARADTGNAAPQRAVRKQSGTQLKPELLDAIPDLLRELLGVAREPDTGSVPLQPSAAPNAPLDEVPPATAENDRLSLYLGPSIVGGAGVLMIAGGVATGLVMQSTHDDYLKLPLQNMADVNRVIRKADSGKTEATVANVLYGVGAAAIVAGAIWLALELSDTRDSRAPRTALVPAIGPGQLGVTLLRRGAGL
jgi:hypothetical protein